MMIVSSNSVPLPSLITYVDGIEDAPSSLTLMSISIVFIVGSLLKSLTIFSEFVAEISVYLTYFKNKR